VVESNNSSELPAAPPPVPAPSRSVWTRIKDHKIAQWTLAYAAAAYALLDGTKIVSEAFDWPHLLIRVITALLILGLPVVATLAWYHGHRALHRVSGPELTIITVLLVMAGAVLWHFAHAPQESSVSKAATAGQTTAASSNPVAATPTVAINEKSIAVLPFVDMSEKQDEGYFSDGLTEELIDRLAGAPGLKVIARTSSFQFKGKNEDVRSIARKLDVANLLEGSVRRSGQSLRITAQLIHAIDGTHLWSHSYDEHISDIFKVQEAIAEKVAKELEFALTTNSTEGARTANLQAYDDVQKGNYFWQRSDVGDEDKALALFQEATRLDPGYALAWRKVASMYQRKGWIGAMAVADARPKALSAAQRALAISPSLASAHNVLGRIYRDFDWNWRSAKEEFETAARLDPNGGYESDVGYLNWILTGDISSGISSMRQDLISDPLDLGVLWGLATAYWAAQRYAESAETFTRLLELNPRYSGASALYARTLLFMGQYEKALATALSDPDKSSQWGVLPCIYWKLGRRSESDDALRELEKDAAKSADSLAEMHACRGEADQAFEWLERGYRERQTGIQEVKFDPYLTSLHEDRRFQTLLRKMNLLE
jgi:TolB-like protein